MAGQKGVAMKKNVGNVGDAPGPGSQIDEPMVGLNFKVPSGFRREFKVWCAERDLSLVDGLVAAFEALKKTQK